MFLLLGYAQTCGFQFLVFLLGYAQSQVEHG